jgi:hypothetical protein
MSNHDFLATFRSVFSLAPQVQSSSWINNVMPDHGDRYRLLTRPHDDHYITAFTTLDSAFVWRSFWANEDHPTLRKDRLIQGSRQRIKGILLQLVLRSRGLVWNYKWKRGILVAAIRPISDSLLTSSNHHQHHVENHSACDAQRCCHICRITRHPWSACKSGACPRRRFEVHYIHTTGSQRRSARFHSFHLMVKAY